jgi:phosphohistidine phosphatase SixA
MGSYGSRMSLAGAVCILLAAGDAQGQILSGDALVNSLRQGGHVLVMRHASSPAELPNKQTANTGNTTLERQLDSAGRANATAMGEAFRRRRIPVGAVLSSPTYRALETVRYAQFGKAQTQPEINESGGGTQGPTEAQTAWLRKKAKEFPKSANTIIVTHSPNIVDAFPREAAGIAQGEALVFGPDGKGGAVVVARIKIEEWPGMRP